MISDYEKLKNKYKKAKKERDNFKIDCDNKDLIIRRQEKKINKLEKENYELICLLLEKIKEDL